MYLLHLQQFNVDLMRVLFMTTDNTSSIGGYAVYLLHEVGKRLRRSQRLQQEKSKNWNLVEQTCIYQK